MPIRRLNIHPENFQEVNAILEAFGFNKNRVLYEALILEALLANNGGSLSDQDGYDDATLPLVDDGEMVEEIAQLVSASAKEFIDDYLFDASLYIERNLNHPRYDQYQISATYNLGGDQEDQLAIGLRIVLDPDFTPREVYLLIEEELFDDQRITMLAIRTS